jgi:hypothetical protein
VHFLAVEADDETPTTARVAELVVKVVRELGQPALAEAFAEYGQRRDRPSEPDTRVPDESEFVLRFPSGMTATAVMSACIQSYTLQSVYARDLVAAHADRFLTLGGLDHPSELEILVLEPVPPLDGRSGELVDAIERARRQVGRFIVLDSPEYGLARADEAEARAFARELSIGLRVTRLWAIVNLNSVVPPPWAGNLAGGPLFESQAPGVTREQREACADALLDEVLRVGQGGARIDWHIGAADFEPGAHKRLQRVVRAAIDGASIEFTFDRPKKPVALAEGLNREHTAILLTVSVDLARLALHAGVGGDPMRFLQKVGSLARLALSAGVQKRAFLRLQQRTRPDVAAVWSGFMLDRARLVVIPEGLDEVVKMITGNGLIAGGASLDFGRQILTRLRDVLRQDGRLAALEACLDFPYEAIFDTGVEPADSTTGRLLHRKSPSVRELLHSAGVLHAAAEGGTLSLWTPDGPADVAARAAIDQLQQAWQQSEVVRVGFVP